MRPEDVAEGMAFEREVPGGWLVVHVVKRLPRTATGWEVLIMQDDEDPQGVACLTSYGAHWLATRFRRIA